MLPHARRTPEARTEAVLVDAEQRRLAVQGLLGAAQEERRGRLGGAAPQGPVPVLTRLALGGRGAE